MLRDDRGYYSIGNMHTESQTRYQGIHVSTVQRQERSHQLGPMLEKKWEKKSTCRHGHLQEEWINTAVSKGLEELERRKKFGGEAKSVVVLSGLSTL